jgi:predicted transcriptional regulator
MTMMKDSQISLRVPSDLRAELQRLADADQRSMSSLMVMALREYVERQSKSKSRKA